MQIFKQYILYVFLILSPFLLTANAEEEFPVLFKGRYRPAEAYARLWLFDIYHSETIKVKDLSAFQATSALDFIFKLNMLGHHPWDNTPLFWINAKEIKHLANLELKRERFSYNELVGALYQRPETSLAIFSYLLTYEFLNAYKASSFSNFLNKFESKQLVPGAWFQRNKDQLILMSIPKNSNWKNIKKGQVFSIPTNPEVIKLSEYKKNAELIFSAINHLNQFEAIRDTNIGGEKDYQKYYEQLKKQNLTVKEINSTLEKSLPIQQRLESAGSLLAVLPGKKTDTWFPLNALNLKIYSVQKNQLIPINNFTKYSDEEFENIRHHFFELKKSFTRDDLFAQATAINNLSNSLLVAYQNLAGQISTEANGKALYYPSLQQLKAEAYYYQYPWVKLLIILYVISTILLCFAYRLNNTFLMRTSVRVLILAFIFHTSLLIWRSYLLNRPPVSNMFETVFYVPWVAMGGALILNLIRRNLLSLIAATLAATLLLTLIEFTELNQSLDNVQAVLDSQFWLFIHVLLVVGSYGMFILGAILAHFYLGLYLFHKQETPTMHLLSESILQSIYLGLAMLIPGTLLGGVWAAESWGRFWDWDPKESWAFISICIYIIWVHAHRYRKIASFGLAIGAVSGLLAISFTWYGVNYILGTGLHSYGFGSGGETLYYGFIGIEVLFMLILIIFHLKKDSKLVS